MLSEINTLVLSPQRARTLKLYSDVRDEYDRLSKVERNGVPFYHPKQILVTIAIKFYRSPKTIENIVFYRVKE